MAGDIRSIVKGGNFFEGPRWHEGNWYVSDFYRHGVFSVSPEGREEQIMTVDAQPSGLGWMPDGSLLTVSMRDHRVLRRWPDGEVTVHASLADYATGWANDMVVDTGGRAWVGNFGCDLAGNQPLCPATLVRVDPDGAVTAAAKDLYFPNGMVITPDGRTLVVAETFGNRLTAFSIDGAGNLSDRRCWAVFGEPPALGLRADVIKQIAVAPDGCCLDAEGHIWVADAIGSRCIRVSQGGAIVEQIDIPGGLGVFACMLGGPEGRTLLMCCAPDSSAKRRAEAAEAELMVCDVTVPHAGLP